MTHCSAERGERSDLQLRREERLSAVEAGLQPEGADVPLMLLQASA